MKYENKFSREHANQGNRLSDQHAVLPEFSADRFSQILHMAQRLFEVDKLRLARHHNHGAFGHSYRSSALSGNHKVKWNRTGPKPIEAVNLGAAQGFVVRLARDLARFGSDK